ncbi:MAG: HU family DNA-binding protein [Bacteroidaceae bacterium]|jgi:DNA-binding protein HU-beta|nr:HU family DNA-binding protein [Bacteroidaceae bacterium]
MNKADLVKAIAAESGLTKKASEAALNAVVASVTKALKEGDKVALIGFGTFSVVEKAERKGVNPATKKEIVIPAKKVVKFKAGAGLEL